MNRKLLSQLRAQAGTSEASLWPTCCRCTEESADLPEGRRWVPVQEYQVDPQVFSPTVLFGVPSKDPNTGLARVGTRAGTEVKGFNLNRPRKRGDRGWFTVIARCHGKEQRTEIDVPIAWSTHHVFAAIQALQFFGGETKPGHGLRAVYGGRG
jgi:hypothetical protein